MRSCTSLLSENKSCSCDFPHIDPAIGASTGFGGVILHGLSTFGFAARAIISAVGGGDPRSLTLFGVRFTAPVKPGDALETSIWEVGPAQAKGHEGETELTFVTRNVATGKVRNLSPPHIFLSC